MTPKKPRRIPRPDKRADYWENQIEKAPTGRQALDALLDHLRGELKHIERTRASEADGLRRMLARKWAADVRGLTKMHPPRSARTDEPPQPPKRPRPLQPVEAGFLRGETIPRPEGPLTHVRGGQRRP